MSRMEAKELIFGRYYTLPNKKAIIRVKSADFITHNIHGEGYSRIDW